MTEKNGEPENQFPMCVSQHDLSADHSGNGRREFCGRSVNVERRGSEEESRPIADWGAWCQIGWGMKDDLWTVWFPKKFTFTKTNRATLVEGRETNEFDVTCSAGDKDGLKELFLRKRIGGSYLDPPRPIRGITE